MEEILRELKERKEYKELSKYLGRSGALRSELIGNVSELCKEPILLFSSPAVPYYNPTKQEK